MTTENELATGAGAKGISRRTVAKGAAWSVPVVLAAVAAPAAAASTLLDVQVSSSCRGVNIGGIGQSFPRFTVTANGGEIPAGTTFTLTSSALASAQIGAGGSLFTVGGLSGNSRTITLTQPIAAGSSINVDITGAAGAFAFTDFTLALAALPAGYTDTNAGNNAATQQLSGASVLGVFVGSCQ